MTVAESAVECLPDSVLACVGNTPLVRLTRLFPHPDVEVIAKLELMNPGGSLKDRPARHIIESGLVDGSIPRGAHLVESSLGNFGIALAIAARLYGLRFTCLGRSMTVRCGLGEGATHPADDSRIPQRSTPAEAFTSTCHWLLREWDGHDMPDQTTLGNHQGDPRTDQGVYSRPIRESLAGLMPDVTRSSTRSTPWPARPRQSLMVTAAAARTHARASRVTPGHPRCPLAVDSPFESL